MKFALSNTMPILVLSSLLFSGCASLSNLGKKQEAVRVTPETLGTSYDYTKPGDIDKQSKPVYILPQVTGGWKKAKVDDANGEWHSGQYVAKVIEPGHWATLEEAELSGKPYLDPGKGNKPIIPIVPRDISQTGEVSVTSIEQKFAKMEKMVSSSSHSPSSTSIGNQAAIPSLPEAIEKNGKPAAPMLNIPGLLPEQEQQTLGKKSKPAPTPFSLSIPPPPIKEATQNPQSSSKLPPPPPLTLPGAKLPSARFDTKNNALMVGAGATGNKFTIQTPKGPVGVAYKDGGRVDVTFNGKTQTVSVSSPTDTVRVDMGD